ncbi:MAG: SRPBCC family protein, partial [Acidimicrobiales bacterium]
MATGRAEIDIKRSADDVWVVVGDFGGIGGWMPGIDSCRVEGDNRILDTMGMT